MDNPESKLNESLARTGAVYLCESARKLHDAAARLLMAADQQLKLSEELRALVPATSHSGTEEPVLLPINGGA